MAEITAAMVKELRDRTGVGMSDCQKALKETQGDLEAAIDFLRKKGMVSALKKESRETKEGMIVYAESDKIAVLVEVNAETDFVVNNAAFQQFATNIAQEVVETQPASVSDLLTQTYSKDKTLTVDQYRAVTMQALGENIQIKRLLCLPKAANSTLVAYSHMKGKIVAVVEIEGSNKETTLGRDIAMHVAAEAPEYLDAQSVPAEVKEREEEIARSQAQGKPAAVVEKIVSGKFTGYCSQFCLVEQKFIKDPDLSIAEVVAKQAKELGTSLKIKQFIRWQVGA
ncbi:MAG: tsf [Chlamydiales bacterium]|jgi:elongation factor Ts|nr:tsf [Chlamydiales bacterium]